MINYKQLAREQNISLATAYRHYPVVHTQATQAQAIILCCNGCSVRQIAAILSISKDRAWRWVKQ